MKFIETIIDMVAAFVLISVTFVCFLMLIVAMLQST